MDSFDAFDEATRTICKVLAGLTTFLILLLFAVYFKREKWNISTALNTQLAICCMLHTIPYIFWDLQPGVFCDLQSAFEPATFTGIFSFCAIIVYMAYIMFACPEQYMKYEKIYNNCSSIICWALSLFVFCLTLFGDESIQTSLGQCRGGKSVTVSVIYLLIILSCIVFTITYLGFLIKNIAPALELSESSEHKRYYFKRMIVIIIVEFLIICVLSAFISLELGYQTNSKTGTSVYTKTLVITETIIPLVCVIGFCYNEKTTNDLKEMIFCKKTEEEEDYTHMNNEKDEEIRRTILENTVSTGV